ncbi:GNAT family N-acetyltransferase [Thalassotalea agarivorans]|uniref:Phosphinothricin acetyltransferase n=1 Tax=Thalassotalea agarivorans TaxID=349064 RepID=A0A1I0H266_THASX|nr:GNAT family N-acetyltransferase [Thalassotalea agarivorans]SET77574.1 phosphinothricin acetyltransferase [Thalassotalea agarivorans]
MATIINCNFAQHQEKISALFNHAIVHTTALYEYKQRSKADIEKWFEDKQTNQLPILGIENEQGELLAFASYGYFRPYPANAKSCECAIYVDPNEQGKGLGRMLLKALKQKAGEQGFHTMVAVIDSDNLASKKLHKICGFSYCGTLKQIAYKFERWLDAEIYQTFLN